MTGTLLRRTTPATLGFDLFGKLDFAHVGLLGHSRGGEGMRAAYQQYRDQGSPWPARIGPANFEGIFEIGPVDGQTSRRLDADGTFWNVLLPMCDGDVSSLQGVRPFDRMLLIRTEINSDSEIDVYRLGHEPQFLQHGVAGKRLARVPEAQTAVRPLARLERTANDGRVQRPRVLQRKCGCERKSGVHAEFQPGVPAARRGRATDAYRSRLQRSESRSSRRPSMTSTRPPGSTRTERRTPRARSPSRTARSSTTVPCNGWRRLNGTRRQPTPFFRATGRRGASGGTPARFVRSSFVSHVSAVTRSVEIRDRSRSSRRAFRFN